MSAKTGCWTKLGEGPPFRADLGRDKGTHGKSTGNARRHASLQGNAPENAQCKGSDEESPGGTYKLKGDT